MASTQIQVPSICIPRVFTSFREDYIEDVFYDLFGKNIKGEQCVTRVDFLAKVDRNTGEDFNVVFVHFEEPLPYSRELEMFVKKISSGQEVKIEYRFPWFWKVRMNNAKPRPQRRGPRMVLTDEDEADLKKHQQEYLKKKQEKAAAAAAEEGELLPTTEA